MADFDLKNTTADLVVSLIPTSETSTPSITGVNTLDYGSVTFATYVGAGGIPFSSTNRIDFIVYDSPDNSTWTVVADYFLILPPGAAAPGGTGIVRSIIAAHASADTTMPLYGYVGKQQYVKCVPTFGGTHGSGTPVGVLTILGHAYHQPIGASSVEV